MVQYRFYLPEADFQSGQSFGPFPEKSQGLHYVIISDWDWTIYKKFPWKDFQSLELPGMS